jgi:hypothetical protein
VFEMRDEDNIPLNDPMRYVVLHGNRPLTAQMFYTTQYVLKESDDDRNNQMPIL